jgi:Rrf2 family protein
MLRLSKKADYALIAMAHLALNAGSVSAREIAEKYEIPTELMAKVLQLLARRGLLASQQGARGGYSLARTATGISVADVIQAIDGPVSVTACSAHADRCGQFATCNVRDPLWRISDIIVSALSKTTVSELANDMSPAAGKAPVRIVAAPARA